MCNQSIFLIRALIDQSHGESSNDLSRVDEIEVMRRLVS